MVHNFRKVIDKIDDEMVQYWVEDLVIIQTFIGLKFHEAILKKAAIILQTTYRLAMPEDESKGIDGFIGDIAISIKPVTYKSKKSLHENFDARMIYYEKVKNGINVDFEELFSSRIS